MTQILKMNPNRQTLNRLASEFCGPERGLAANPLLGPQKFAKRLSIVELW